MEATRFKLLREEFGFTQQAFAENLGIGSTTADIERGKTKLSGIVVTRLMRQFNVNPLWLYGFSKNKFLNEVSEHSIFPRVLAVDSSDREKILMVNQKAAAGYPQNIQDVDWYDQLPQLDIPLPEFRNASYRGFQVEGDSMLPYIRPGDWVLGRAVSGMEEAADNKIHIVVLLDSVLVKKIEKIPGNPQKIKLISYNETYAPMEVLTRNIQELWQVTGKLTFGIEEHPESLLFRQLKASMEDLKNQIKNIR